LLAPDARHVLKYCNRIADSTASDPKQHFAVTCIIPARCGPIGLVASARRAVKRRSLGIYEDAMTLKFPAATQAAKTLALFLAAVAFVVVGFAATDASAAKRRHSDRSGAYGPGGPNVSYQSGPRTRVYISRRSWLDAGTEVLPGDRKFTDYAFPPAVGYPSFARENLNRPIDRQPLSAPADLGGYPTAFPLY
jgi:hypothetical protein